MNKPGTGSVVFSISMTNCLLQKLQAAADKLKITRNKFIVNCIKAVVLKKEESK